MNEAELNVEIARRAIISRRGTHVVDGVMWCPTCGANHVTNGNRTCPDCEPSDRLTAEGLVQFAKKEYARSEAQDKISRKQLAAEKKAGKGEKVIVLGDEPTEADLADAAEAEAAEKSSRGRRR